ncbi:MAG: PTS transporter subunit IIC, partial [Erysipelotrichaceae bacterium]
MLDAILGQTRNTALIVGIIALVGLLLQRKSAVDVISGTAKTIMGFMIFNIGSSFLGTIVANFTTLFNTGFGIDGVTTQVEVATAMALDTYGTEVALVLLVGFAANLLFAKFTPFKAIFLTGQHFLYFACVLALVFIAFDLPTVVTVIGGGIILGFCGAALPTLCQPFMNKITGDDKLAIGHFNCFGYALSGYIGKLFKSSNKEKGDASNVNLPGFFSLFRDFIFSIAIFMVVLFYIAVFACVATGNMEVVQTMSGNDLWFVYPLLQGLQFAAGMSVLIYGVRQFIAEITAAFVAISE